MLIYIKKFKYSISLMKKCPGIPGRYKVQFFVWDTNKVCSFLIYFSSLSSVVELRTYDAAVTGSIPVVSKSKLISSDLQDFFQKISNFSLIK